MSDVSGNATSSPTNSRTDDIIVGSGYCILALIDILLSVPCMIVFRDQELRDKDSYMFMFHMGVWDLIQAAMHLVAGIYTVLPISMNQVPHWLDSFFGGVISTGYLVYLLLSTLLAINRFVCIVFPQKVKSIFTSRVTKNLILASYLYALIWMAVYLSPFVNFVYQKDVYLYYYDDSVGSERAHAVDEYLGRFMIIIMGFCYLGVIVTLHVMRKRMVADCIEQQRARSRELRITIQVSIIFVLTFLLQGAWTIIPTVIPNMTTFEYVALNTGWILINGVNPVIYFVLNPTIRHKVLKLFGFHINDDGNFGRTMPAVHPHQTMNMNGNLVKRASVQMEIRPRSRTLSPLTEKSPHTRLNIKRLSLQGPQQPLDLNGNFVGRTSVEMAIRPRSRTLSPIFENSPHAKLNIKRLSLQV